MKTAKRTRREVRRFKSDVKWHANEPPHDIHDERKKCKNKLRRAKGQR